MRTKKSKADAPPPPPMPIKTKCITVEIVVPEDFDESAVNTTADLRTLLTARATVLPAGTMEALDPPPHPSSDPREGRVYDRDFRAEKPALHRLYVQWAVNDLMVINKALQSLFDTGRICTLEAASALMKERDRLVVTDAAWGDAEVYVRNVYKHLGKQYPGLKPE